MRVSNLFLGSCAAASVSAGCFSSGFSWGNEKQTAIDEIKRLCDDGILSGAFTRNEYKIACINLGTGDGQGKKADLRIQADGLDAMPDPLVIVGAGDCAKYLHLEVNGCNYGGATTYDFTDQGHFTFVADPNNGNCA
ncbi:hypothetical protein AK830_g2761 [Neonectria ditissima]|uniref:Ecp2 effector protein domain-containing protein n=1 Tax=Neonectria ditissima TaxID=78410 RepID=A0A0P7B1N9_9HYPO|nr:hypothetical protein AK830_g2761 [Neonectria ditissima]